MSKHETVAAWKNAALRTAATPANPAGARLVEVSEEQLQNASGAAISFGFGRVFTLSYECMGFSCAGIME